MVWPGKARSGLMAPWRPLICLTRLHGRIHHSHRRISSIESVKAQSGRRGGTNTSRSGWRWKGRQVSGRRMTTRMWHVVAIGIGGGGMGSHANVRLHLVRCRGLLTMSVTWRWLHMPMTVLPGHHPSLAIHGRQFCLLLQVLELWVACMLHRRLPSMSTSVPTLPFAHRVVSIQYRCEVPLTRWIGGTKVRQASQRWRYSVHLVYGIGAIARRRIVGVGGWIRRRQHSLIWPKGCV